MDDMTTVVVAIVLLWLIFMFKHLLLMRRVDELQRDLERVKSDSKDIENGLRIAINAIANLEMRMDKMEEESHHESNPDLQA